MALKKSQLYSSLWQSCDELRGGMDASQYKDYVLTLLFMKYVSDKYAADLGALIEAPAGGGFAVEGVKEVIRSDPEWKAKLNRSVFSNTNIARAIEKCRRLFGVAAGVAARVAVWTAGVATSAGDPPPRRQIDVEGGTSP